MKDRQPGAPGQYKAVITAAEQQKMQAGEAFVITMTRDDQPLVEGTPYNKASVLPDDLAELICPDVLDPTPADALRSLYEGGKASYVNVTLSAAGWTASEAAGFEQSVVVDGLTDEKKVRVYPAIPATLAEKLALAEETPKVKASTRTGNTMTFEAWEEAPALDIPIIVEVMV